MEFWQLTPYEYDVIVKAYIKREESNFEQRVFQAWQTANLTRAEKLPNFNELMNKANKPEPQSAEQMLATVKMLHAALGGD